MGLGFFLEGERVYCRDIVQKQVHSYNITTLAQKYALNYRYILRTFLIRVWGLGLDIGIWDWGLRYRYLNLGIEHWGLGLGLGIGIMIGDRD